MMKNLRLTMAALAMAAASSSALSAAITTTFSSNNSQDGNMFDVVTLGGALNVTGFDLNLDAGTFSVEIYKKSGTWVGFQNTAAAWTLVDSGAVTSTGVNTASFFDVADFVLDASSTTALYITVLGGARMKYTNGTGVGDVAASNADLQILQGAGNQYAFAATFMPRIWNGSIYYEAASVVPESVPEPVSAALVGLGLAGLMITRRKMKA